LQNRWHRFWAVCSFRCEGDSPETPEISPEIPDFPETPEKSPEYPGFTDKFVLSGDFQDSPIHPPSRRHQDPFTKEGTFVHQAKYTKDIVRKFKMEDSKAMTTQMSTTTALDADEEGEHMDQKEYRSMIGSLLYLTATRPDIQFSVCLCARFQASPRTSHRQAVKRIFRYFRHTPNFGLWYSASSSLALNGFSDADFAGCRLDR
jgi:hypothetical protein